MVTFSSRDEMLKALPKGLKIAEVGVFLGHYAQIILDTCQPSQLHLIDPWEGSCTAGDKDGLNYIEVPDLEVAYREVCQRFVDNPFVNVMRGPSWKMLGMFPDYSLDFIYIDGDHSYEGVKSDLHIATRKAWLVGGHDYHHQGLPGITQAVDEFCHDNGWSIAWITADGCPSFVLKRGQ